MAQDQLRAARAYTPHKRNAECARSARKNAARGFSASAAVGQRASLPSACRVTIIPRCPLCPFPAPSRMAANRRAPRGAGARVTSWRASERSHSLPDRQERARLPGAAGARQRAAGEPQDGSRSRRAAALRQSAPESRRAARTRCAVDGCQEPQGSRRTAAAAARMRKRAPCRQSRQERARAATGAATGAA